ncbi:MAG TPA: hypothetical protein VFE53_06430 [Mucilaginibacter sp.]|jgi:hypothetical protein|nr:hypothetical protein [Mucilaginibacter sp.]
MVDKTKDGLWISKMHMKRGALHKELGVPEDKKIPAKKLKKAEHSKNPKLRKRAILAATLGKLRK